MLEPKTIGASATETDCPNRLELMQEPYVVLVQLSNIGDTVSPHTQAFYAKSKGETCDFLGIVTNCLQHVGPTSPRMVFLPDRKFGLPCS